MCFQSNSESDLFASLPSDLTNLYQSQHSELCEELELSETGLTHCIYDAAQDKKKYDEETQLLDSIRDQRTREKQGLQHANAQTSKRIERLVSVTVSQCVSS